MSVCRKLPDGTIQKIAGHTILLDANASEVRHGTFNVTGGPAGWVEQIITFSDPMPDTDYVVVLECNTQNWGGGENSPGPFRIHSKSTTGFVLSQYNTTGAAGFSFIGTYTAWKPVKIEGYTELQNKVENPDDTPTIDSMNLVTSDGVARAIENASAVWKGTRAEWNALPATDKMKYDLAVLTDIHLIKSVDRTDGSDTDVADLSKTWKGTRAEWDALPLAERKTWPVAFITDKQYIIAVNATSGAEIVVADYTGKIFRGSYADWEALTDAERAEYEQAEIINDGIELPVMGVCLLKTLTVGQTSVTFTHPYITPTAFIDVYSSNPDVGYTSVTTGTGTFTVTFTAQSSNMQVGIKVFDREEWMI